MAWVYILRGGRRYYIGATDDLERRLTEHMRGSNHTTRRFGAELVLIAAKQLPSMIANAEGFRGCSHRFRFAEFKAGLQ
ncbi:MAG TPA: GIY-YIG nuclease family protein [Chthoniobacterales bacterium]|jgi:predicted GIY-YIG superfamily endonuclease|nr:GIY-YIG nuclease family protein [Chthoniobacterales bacterium]